MSGETCVPTTLALPRKGMMYPEWAADAGFVLLLASVAQAKKRLEDAALRTASPTPFTWRARDNPDLCRLSILYKLPKYKSERGESNPRLQLGKLG